VRALIGKTIAHYRIIEKLGEGGMGEVYLAEDTHLKRKAAIKVLPEHLHQDGTAHKRFIREARSAAALDHPFICNIHEIAQTDDGQDYIVMEYVEGQSLKDQLREGRIPEKESLRIGSEIAEALNKAHREGIVHRDLKPSNIMLTLEGHAKVMDFGLAKKVVKDNGTDQDITSALTREGSTLGTLAYMSPEQVRAETVDHRSDIFSYGIVLYEMLTGVHPFKRNRYEETITAILRSDPHPLSRYMDDVPEILQHSVLKMLAKVPDERYQSVHEVLTNLNRLRETSGEIRTELKREDSPISSRIWRTLTLILAVVLAALAVWTMWFQPDPTSDSTGPTMRSSFLLPEGERLASGSTFRHSVAVSPNGQWLAYVSYRPGEGDEQDGEPVINLRRLDQADVRSIPGLNPVFSADSRELAFVDGDGRVGYSLWRTRLEGGQPEMISPIENMYNLPGFGFAWLPDGKIIFTTIANAGLFVVPEVGGEVRQLTRLDEEAGEISHRLPSILPDGRTILYTLVRYLLVPDWSKSQIVALNVDSGETKVLIEGGSDGRYVESGHLLFAREGRLMAVRFNPERLEVEGDPVPILDGLVHTINTGHGIRETGAIQFAVSHAGLLIYAPGEVFPERKSQILWVDRQGGEEPLPIDTKLWAQGQVSADNRFVLLFETYPPRKVYLYDIGRNMLRPQTFEDQPYSSAILGPSDRQFTFDSNLEGPQALYMKSLNSGPGGAEKLGRDYWSENHMPGSWTSDGRHLAVVSFSNETDFDIWILDRNGERSPFVQTTFDERYPDFSPDGKWLAYSSNESGKYEVYVRPYPDPGKPVQISTAGGMEPCWSRNQQVIFYRVGLPSNRRDQPLPSYRQAFYSVNFKIEDGQLHPELPDKLFEGEYISGGPVRRYDVGPDGRFLMMKLEPGNESRIREAMAPTHIKLVQNWFEELREKVPVE
jgi:serine/threonine-protein kinase